MSPSHSRPLVTAVVPTHDRPDYLRRAVESVVSQSYERLELVVVDDNPSTPASTVLEDVPTEMLENCEVVRGCDHACANDARNTGIEVANGEYVAFLDDDDRWVEEKVERQVAAMEAAGEDVGVAYTGTWEVREDGRSEHVPPAVEGDLTKELLCHNVVGTMSVVMVRTDLAERVPFDDEFRSWGDIQWYIDLSTRTGFERLPEPLTVYDFTSHGRLSENLERNTESYRRFVRKYRPLAARYGRLFARKVEAWAAFRLGADAFHGGEYGFANRYFSVALRRYPLEPRFLVHYLVSAGGAPAHDVARTVRSVFS